MAWFDRFFPTYEYETATKIPYPLLYTQGIRGVIFDIDNTLVGHGAPACDDVKRLFKELYDIGFQTMLLSNNGKSRVESFASAVGSMYIARAGKPSEKGYIAAMKKMGTTRDTTIFVGDQLFTDIRGANRAGIASYLVKPVDKEIEIQIILKRYVEKILWKFYRKRGK